MCVALWELSVGMQPLSSTCFFPPGWRLGLSAKGGGGMGGKGQEGRGGGVDQATYPQAEEVGGGLLVSKDQRSRKEKQRRGLKIGKNRCRY